MIAGQCRTYGLCSIKLEALFSFKKKKRLEVLRRKCLTTMIYCVFRISWIETHWMFTHQIGVVESCKIIVFFLDNPWPAITFLLSETTLDQLPPILPSHGRWAQKTLHPDAAWVCVRLVSIQTSRAITVKYQKVSWAGMGVKPNAPSAFHFKLYASSATVSFFPYMFLLCLCFRVIDRPRRTRRVVRASSKISSEHSTASACFSNSYVLSSGRKFNSHRSPAAADAVQVRSHAGCGLFIWKGITSLNKHLTSNR